MSRVLNAYLTDGKALKSFIRKRFRGDREVDDIAQEVFLRAFKIECSQFILRPRALLYEIARNLIVSEIRSSTSRQTVIVTDTQQEDVGDDQPDAESQIESSRKFAVFMQAVASLPLQTRRVFALRRFDGLSQRDTAAQLQISESAVEKHVALALYRCSAFLRERGYPVSVEARRRATADKLPAQKKERVD